MRHFFCGKYSILLRINSEDLFRGCQPPPKRHGPVNIQGLQVGLPSLPTLWFMHHNGECRCIVRYFKFEDYDEFPTRESTGKPGHIK